MLTIIVASSVSGADFGRFSAVFGFVLVIAGVAGALCFEPLVMTEASERHRSQRNLLLLAVAIGVLGSLALAGGSLVFVSLRDVLVLLALGLPVLTVMEVLRGLLNYTGRTKLLFWLDVLWTALSAALLVGAGQIISDPSPGVLGLLWCAAAVPSIAAGIFATRGADDAHTWPESLRNTRRFGPSFVFEYLISSGLAQVTPIVVASAATFQAAGELRLIQVAFGPVTALFAGIRIVMMPQFRDRRQEGGSLRAPLVVVVTVLAAAALLWGLGLALLDERRLTSVFGDTWPAAAALLPAALAIRLLNALSIGAILVARVTERVAGSRHVRIAVGLIMLLGSAIGAHQNGAQGAVYGLLVAQAAGVLAWYSLIRPEIFQAGATA